jgi:hypothetical protein
MPPEYSRGWVLAIGYEQGERTRAGQKDVSPVSRHAPSESGAMSLTS